jgi:hypothetical protein
MTTSRYSVSGSPGSNGGRCGHESLSDELLYQRLREAMMPQSKTEEILAAHGWQLTAEHDEIPGVVPPPNAQGFVAMAEPVSLGAVELDPVKAVRVRSAVADRCGVVLHRLAEFPNVVLVEDLTGRGHVTEHESGVRRVMLLPL